VTNIQFADLWSNYCSTENQQSKSTREKNMTNKTTQLSGTPAKNAAGNYNSAAVRTDMPDNKESTMDWKQIEGNWENVKGKVKDKWTKFTTEDLSLIKGNRDLLVSQLLKTYDFGKEEAEKQVNDFKMMLNSRSKDAPKSAEHKN
jgi:uncharacterized protein YjbJ (UPF0337 family)